jgi:hypothetical protein
VVLTTSDTPPATYNWSVVSDKYPPVQDMTACTITALLKTSGPTTPINPADQTTKGKPAGVQTGGSGNILVTTGKNVKITVPVTRVIINPCDI